MNTVMLNAVSLDGGVIIKRGSGGGGNSGGGGGNTPGGGDTPTPDMPIIGDGKTYLYIKYPNKRLGKITLNFSQSVNYGVYIDWGDGSELGKAYGEGDAYAQHTYEEAGEYVISLSPIEGCILGFGRSSKSYPILGNGQEKEYIYSNMLQAVEIGNSVTSIGDRAFSGCHSLSNIVIPESVISIGSYAFNGCSSLSNIVIPESVTSIGSYAFYGCSSLSSVVILNGVTSIGNSAFYNCYGIRVYDLSKCTAIPTLEANNVFYNISSDCKFIIPDALFDEWKSASNWSSHASKMVKASEFNG